MEQATSSSVDARQGLAADVDPAENIAVSEAAMADPDAFARLILRILVPVTARLSPTELRLARDDPPEVGL